ncbi:MAG: toll/interleukin-1 receptor domain-containing protein [Magnetococcales bacterium]|nr:toll/interleukin-1 receptor domain-containing protein [Magnetococcales bacterium]
MDAVEIYANIKEECESMDKPVIFISYSHKCKKSTDIIEQLSNNCSDKYDFFYDKYLNERPEEEWLKILYENIHKSSGAIMLLSSKVMKSEYVKAEANIISYKKIIDNRFILYCVVDENFFDCCDPFFQKTTIFEKLQCSRFSEKSVDEIKEFLEERIPSIQHERARTNDPGYEMVNHVKSMLERLNINYAPEIKEIAKKCSMISNLKYFITHYEFANTLLTCREQEVSMTCIAKHLSYGIVSSIVKDIKRIYEIALYYRFEWEDVKNFSNIYEDIKHTRVFKMPICAHEKLEEGQIKRALRPIDIDVMYIRYFRTPYENEGINKIIKSIADKYMPGNYTDDELLSEVIDLGKYNEIILALPSKSLDQNMLNSLRLRMPNIIILLLYDGTENNNLNYQVVGKSIDKNNQMHFYRDYVNGLALINNKFRS